MREVDAADVPKVSPMGDKINTERTARELAKAPSVAKVTNW
jgi:hypothetical protein